MGGIVCVSVLWWGIGGEDRRLTPLGSDYSERPAAYAARL